MGHLFKKEIRMGLMDRMTRKLQELEDKVNKLEEQLEFILKINGGNVEPVIVSEWVSSGGDYVVTMDAASDPDEPCVATVVNNGEFTWVDAGEVMSVWNKAATATIENLKQEEQSNVMHIKVTDKRTELPVYLDNSYDGPIGP